MKKVRDINITVDDLKSFEEEVKVTYEAGGING
jgi:hypothetical protein